MLYSAHIKSRDAKPLLFYVLFQPEEIVDSQPVHKVRVRVKILVEKLHELMRGHLPM